MNELQQGEDKMIITIKLHTLINREGRVILQSASEALVLKAKARLEGVGVTGLLIETGSLVLEQ